jgi:hypothetical protein
MYFPKTSRFSGVVLALFLLSTPHEAEGEQHYEHGRQCISEILIICLLRMMTPLVCLLLGALHLSLIYRVCATLCVV